MRKEALLALVVLQGCASHTGVRPLRPLELATARYQDVSGTALTGSLLYEDGCLLFRDEESKTLLLPIWPAGSTFNGTSVIFHEPAKADQRLIIGEEIAIQGQAYAWSSLAHDYYQTFERQCSVGPFVVGHVRPAN